MKAIIAVLFSCISFFTLVSAGPLDTLSPGTWYQAPGTLMSAVAPTYGQFAGTWGGGPGGVMAAWGGGALDTKRNRLIVWGGGHGDYYGNEIYVFDIPAMKWTRLTDPTANPTLPGPNWDGTPSSRHSYNQLAYVEHADVLFNMGGGTCGCGTPAQFTEGRTWAFDFAQNKWSLCNPPTDGPGGVYAMPCSYDPVSKKVWFGHENNGLWDYNYSQKLWTKHNSENGFYYYTSVIDTKRGLFVEVGNGNVFAYDIGHNNFAKQIWTTTGGAAFISKANVGLAYDPVSDKIVGWAGGAVYALNPDTKVWTVYNATGAPASTPNGIFGRFRYVPAYNVFVVATDWNANVSFFKLTAGTGIEAEKNAPSGACMISATPNPFRTSVLIRVPGAWNSGACSIYNLDGRMVKRFPQGEGSMLTWNAENVPAGVYLIRLTSGSRHFERQVTLMK